MAYGVRATQFATSTVSRYITSMMLFVVVVVIVVDVNRKLNFPYRIAQFIGHYSAVLCRLRWWAERTVIMWLFVHSTVKFEGIFLRFHRGSTCRCVVLGNRTSLSVTLTESLSSSTNHLSRERWRHYIRITLNDDILFFVPVSVAVSQLDIPLNS